MTALRPHSFERCVEKTTFDYGNCDGYKRASVGRLGLKIVIFCKQSHSIFKKIRTIPLNDTLTDWC
jgi:hypothetical protein